MARVLVLLPDGCEEIEAVTIVDILRRGGVEVVMASLTGRFVHGSHNIGLEADATLDEIARQSFDMLVLPGGQPGATHLGADARVLRLLREYAAEGRYLAAICAAPGVLVAAGLLQGKRATSFPGAIADVSTIEYLESAVVRDGQIVTSRGPGTAMDFSLTLLALLMGEDVKARVEARLQRPKP